MNDDVIVINTGRSKIKFFDYLILRKLYLKINKLKIILNNQFWRESKAHYKVSDFLVIWDYDLS